MGKAAGPRLALVPISVFYELEFVSANGCSCSCVLKPQSKYSSFCPLFRIVHHDLCLASSVGRLSLCRKSDPWPTVGIGSIVDSLFLSSFSDVIILGLVYGIVEQLFPANEACYRTIVLFESLLWFFEHRIKARVYNVAHKFFCSMMLPVQARFIQYTWGHGTDDKRLVIQ